MKDDELIDRFEAGTLAPGSFRHREHVQVAWIYLQRYGRDGAEPRLAAGLRAFAARAGRPDRFDAALTRAWVASIDGVRRETGATTFEALLAARPALLDPTAVKVEV